MKRRKQLLTLGFLLIAGTVALYVWASLRTRGPHSELKFVGHVTNGITHVVLFRLKCNNQRGELADPGKICWGTANFDARWVTKFSAKVPSNGEREFGVIAPYERTPWRLQLTFADKPPAFWIKLRTSWVLLKARKTAAFPDLKAVWRNKGAVPSMSWQIIRAQAQLNKPLWREVIASDLVTNTAAGN